MFSKLEKELLEKEPHDYEMKVCYEWPSCTKQLFIVYSQFQNCTERQIRNTVNDFVSNIIDMDGTPVSVELKYWDPEAKIAKKVFREVKHFE